jgi:hypothetical protein
VSLFRILGVNSYSVFMSKDYKYLHPEDAKELKKNQKIARFLTTEAPYNIEVENFDQEEWVEGL